MGQCYYKQLQHPHVSNLASQRALASRYHQLQCDDHEAMSKLGYGIH